MAFVAIAIVSATATIGGAVMSIQGQKNAAKAAEQAADWNADQANKQADYNDSVAQKNMRRERENNKRELARRRASAARGGLAESGAVTDNLIEASSRHQQEIDDIWERAAAQSSTMRAKGEMGIWEAAVGSEAAKTNMWATGIGAVGSVAQTAMKFKGPSAAPKAD
jgi:hypothetical protein